VFFYDVVVMMMMMMMMMMMTMMMMKYNGAPKGIKRMPISLSNVPKSIAREAEV